MTNNNPYQVYQQTQVKTLSQGKLILMLYDGAIRFAKQAKIEMESKNYGKSSDFLIRAQDIINELDLTLDLSAGQVAENLHRVYQSINYQLVQANVKSDPVIIDRVCKMMEDLYSAWAVILNMPQFNEASEGSISA